MRITALFLVLSLTAPTVGAAICGLTCAERHRDAATAQTEDCHQHQADADAVTMTSAGTPCRHVVEVLTSIVPATSTYTPRTTSIAIQPVVTVLGATGLEVGVSGNIALGLFDLILTAAGWFGSRWLERRR